MGIEKTNACPLPKLVFNDSQEITKIRQGSSIRFTAQNASPNSEPGTVPNRGVVYHDLGFTRIFDSNGKQILFVNDSESIARILAGHSIPVTYVYGLQENMEIRDEGNDVTIIYEKGTDNCVATIIHAPGSSDPQ
jgi:hypothetical protein